MIIGISGYAGVGKDTVGKIIQTYLQNPLDSKMGISTFEIKKFAGKIKQIASIILDIDAKNFEDEEFKNTKLGPEWDIHKSYSINKDETFPSSMTVREFLQKIGTEALRDGLHPDIWVNALMVEYRPPKLSQYSPSKWIITDVRFPNEAKRIKEMGGSIIRVNRPGVGPLNNHPSEKSLDDWKFDSVIDNDSDKNVLNVKTIEALGQLRFF